MKGFRGHCVTDGPFANLSVPWAGTITVNHCLSRSFLEGQELKHWTDLWNDTLMEDVMDAPTFEEFRQKLEEGPHLSLAHLVHGDFSVGTAPVGSSHPRYLS